MINIKDNKEIQVLYHKMVETIKDTGFNVDELVTFTCRVGRDYPVEPYKGILFYGRATNGWDDDDEKNKDLEQVIIDNINRGSQLFKLLHPFAEKFYGDSWLTKVAWSNICKIAPNGGNPSTSLWYAQRDSLTPIIRKEIELLSPEIVVLVTGNTAVKKYADPWHSPFFEAFPDLKRIKSIKWAESRGKDCSATLYSNGNMKVILTDRPESRPILEHAHTLIKLLE